MSLSPEPGVIEFRQWRHVGSNPRSSHERAIDFSSFLILDSSVGLWAGIEFAGTWVSETSKFQS